MPPAAPTKPNPPLLNPSPRYHAYITGLIAISAFACDVEVEDAHVSGSDAASPEPNSPNAQLTQVSFTDAETPAPQVASPTDENDAKPGNQNGQTLHSKGDAGSEDSPAASPSNTSDAGNSETKSTNVDQERLSTTPDAGVPDASTPSVEEPDANLPPSEPGIEGIVAVGYGGLRIVSRDLGQSWEDETHWSTNGGDDRDLLRTIAYGNGLWVSGGWRFTTSTDGVTWTDRGNAVDIISAINCQITDGMAFGAGEFLVACGSNLAASSNGLDWERRGRTPDVGGHPHIVFDDQTQQFACSGDNGSSFVSGDGAEWTSIAIDSVRLCDNGLAAETDCPSFYYQGVFLSAEWGGAILRSTGNSRSEERYSDTFGNNLFTSYAFAAGRVAP